MNGPDSLTNQQLAWVKERARVVLALARSDQGKPGGPNRGVTGRIYQQCANMPAGLACLVGAMVESVLAGTLAESELAE